MDRGRGRTRKPTRRSDARVVLGVVGTLILAVAVPFAHAADRPDLTVTSLSRPPSFRSPGADLKLTDKVKNAGDKASPPSIIRFYLSRDRTRGGDIALDGSRKVPRLGPGGTSKGTVTVTVPLSTPTYVYSVLACADAGKDVRETKEQNNCRVASAQILVDAEPESANPLSVGSTLGTGETTATIEAAAGGMLATVGPDGTAYELVVPADSLLADTAITMTPLASIDGASSEFSFTGGLAGVNLEPSGLRLYRGATLTIEPTSTGPEGTAPTGFAFSGDGEQFHLHPWKIVNSAIEIGLTHFSGFGIGNASEGDLATLSAAMPLETHIEFRSEQSLGDLMAQLNAGEITPEEFSDAASTTLLKDFMRYIVPVGQQALKDDADEAEAIAAVDACVSWGRQVEILDLMDHASPQLGMKPRTAWNECLKQIAKIAKKRFDLAHKRCEVDSAQIDRMLNWARLSELLLEGGADGVLGADHRQKISECMGPTDGFSGTIDGVQTASGGARNFRYVWHATVTFDKTGTTSGTTIYALDAGTVTVTVEDYESPCEIVDGTAMFDLEPNPQSYVRVTSAGFYIGSVVENDGATIGKLVPVTIDCSAQTGVPNDIRETEVKVPDPSGSAYWWGTPQGLGNPKQMPDGSLQGSYDYTNSAAITTGWEWDLRPASP